MPLTSWTCDSCEDEITDPALGLLIWREEENGAGYDFRLVHKNIDGRDCDPGAQRGFVSNVAIDRCLGAVGQAALLAFLSMGPLAGPSGTFPRVKNFDQFVDVFRRLQTPWYEEARSRFGDEDVARWLGDANEHFPYIPEVLERIVNRTLGL